MVTPFRDKGIFLFYYYFNKLALLNKIKSGYMLYHDFRIKIN